MQHIESTGDNQVFDRLIVLVYVPIGGVDPSPLSGLAIAPRATTRSGVIFALGTVECTRLPIRSTEKLVGAKVGAKVTANFIGLASSILPWLGQFHDLFI